MRFCNDTMGMEGGERGERDETLREGGRMRRVNARMNETVDTS